MNLLLDPMITPSGVIINICSYGTSLKDIGKCFLCIFYFAKINTIAFKLLMWRFVYNLLNTLYMFWFIF